MEKDDGFIYCVDKSKERKNGDLKMEIRKRKNGRD